MSTMDLGLVTAYGYAKAGGYTGTEAQFQKYLSDIVTATTQASDSAELAGKWTKWEDTSSETPSATNNAKYWASKAKAYAGLEDLDASDLTYTLEDGTEVNLASFLKIIEDLDGETLLLL